MNETTQTDGRCSPDCTCCCKHRHKPRPRGKHCVKCGKGHTVPARIEHGKRTAAPEQMVWEVLTHATRARWRYYVHDNFILVEDANDGAMSVTNDAEAVVAALAKFLPFEIDLSKRILYRDTDGTWDEITHMAGKFIGFRHIGAKTAQEAMTLAVIPKLPISPPRPGADLTPSERTQLEKALCTLADHEGVLHDALSAKGLPQGALGHVCDALRLLVDGE